MDVLSAILITLGMIGGVGGFCAAIVLRSNAKILKISLLCGVVCIVLAIVGFSIMPKNPSSSSNKNSATCQSCHTTYSYDDTTYSGYDYDNVRSIKKTNMCERCYKNYKYAIS